MDGTPDNDLIRAAQAGDEAAWETLYRRHAGARWTQIVRMRRLSGIDHDALESELNLAFVRSVRNFDPDRGIKFITYLWYALRRATHQPLTCSPIRVHHSALHRFPEAAQRALNRISLHGDDGSLLTDPAAEQQLPDLDDQFERHLLRRGLARLPLRERHVLKSRLKGESLQKIADRMQVTKERIRQIETRATDRLRTILTTRRAA